MTYILCVQVRLLQPARTGWNNISLNITGKQNLVYAKFQQDSSLETDKLWKSTRQKNEADEKMKYL